MAEVDMDAIARLVTEAGYVASVEQTGGGTATVYAGNTSEGYRVCAGPGRFAGPGWTVARGDTGDFCIFPIEPDDDVDGDAGGDPGNPEAPYYTATDIDDEKSLASEIVRRLTAQNA